VKSIYGIGSEESDDGDPRGLWPNVTIPQFYGIEPFPGFQHLGKMVVGNQWMA
jgi:hypothetical protein